MLRIRNVCLGSQVRLFSIPNPGSELFPSRIPDPRLASNNLSILTQKWFLSSSKYDPGYSSRIPGPDPDLLPIPDQGFRGHKGSATLKKLLSLASKVLVTV